LVTERQGCGGGGDSLVDIEVLIVILGLYTGIRLAKTGRHDHHDYGTNNEQVYLLCDLLAKTVITWVQISGKLIADTQNSLSEGLPYGRYQIRKRLARGGMGEVFLADQMGPTGQPIRPVALKRMLPRMARKPHAAQMFLEEMATAAQLNHPNIATTYDFGEVNGSYFMAMEYLEGLSLHQILSTIGAVPVAHAIRIGLNILEALDHAHKRKTPAGQDAPVVHRDISPHNVMICTSGAVKLLDFGIARAETEVLGGRLEGKIAYAAPEQLRGDSVDRRSDLWAVGVLLYESLCGVRPYEHQDAQMIVEAARRQDFAPIGSLRPEASPLESVITRSLRYDPAQRWPSAESMHYALQHAEAQFENLSAVHMTKLVMSAGGPQKSSLGVEHITSFGGTAVGDASNRTATIQYPGKSGGNQSSSEAHYDTRAGGSQPGDQEAIDRGTSKPRNMVVIALLASVMGFMLVMMLRSKTEPPSITSRPLIAKELAPVVAIPKTKAVVPAAPKIIPPARIAAKPTTAKPRVKKVVKRPKPRRRQARPPVSKRKTPIRRAPQKTVPLKVKTAVVRPSPAVTSGRLSVKSTPWARIQIDGDDLGVTPKLNIKLQVGRHKLILSPADGTTGQRKAMMLTIKPGQHIRVIANFESNVFRTLGD
jgi:serine/threonine protein kinase